MALDHHCFPAVRRCTPSSGICARLCSPSPQRRSQTCRGLRKYPPCKAGSVASVPRSSCKDSMATPSQPLYQGLAASGWAVCLSNSVSNQESWQQIEAASATTSAIPRAPPEWQSPTDPSGPSAPPEFTPPRSPETMPGTAPEFEPPEQAPPGRPRPSDPPTPGRPARPDEIPDPERDPLRTPERRRETGEPSEEPEEEAEPEEQDTAAAVLAYVEDCQETFGIVDDRGAFVEIGLGQNSCPAAILYHPTGYNAVVNMHGANVVSWQRPDGTDVLYLRPDSPMDGSSPILGGIPIIFPQYGRASGIAAYAGVGNSMMPTNGLLNRLHWSLVETAVSPQYEDDPAPTAIFAAESDESTYASWPFHFQATYVVSVMYADDLPEEDIGPPLTVRGAPNAGVMEGAPASADRKRSSHGAWKALDDKGNVKEEEQEDEEQQAEEAFQEDTSVPVQLRCVLQIRNIDDKPFSFEAALQSHVSVRQIEQAQAMGLFGKLVLDCDSDPDKPWLHTANDHNTTFGETRIDRVYVNAGDKENGPVYIQPGDPCYDLELIHRQGFRDVGLWNPHLDLLNRTLYREFVAFSSGTIARPVTLQPEESWTGEMILRLHARDNLV